MTSASELTRLLQQALDDPRAEPPFFRALLAATVYAHAPRGDRSGGLRFLQVTTPEGLTALPFFSDEHQAKAAANSVATVAVLTGRQLFEATRGATLMLNPTTVGCVLYPEEVAALLDQGEVAIVEQIKVDGQSLRIGPVAASAAVALDRLATLYTGLSSVTAAYAAQVQSPHAPEQGLLIAIAVASGAAEHAVRATITALQAQPQGLEVPMDLTTFEPGALPAWLKDAGIQPFHQRALGEWKGLAPGGSRK